MEKPNLEEMSDSELIEYRKKLKSNADLQNIYQMVYKTTMNSLYGFLGNEFARFYSTDMAEAITITGQLVIQWVAKYLNEFISDATGVKKDYVVYSDTDSVYVELSDLVHKFLPEADKDKIIHFIDKLSEDKIELVIQKSFDDLSGLLNASEPESLKMKREVIADVGIWQAKKRYALNVWNSEGIQYSEPKTKIMGMETAKSSTPAIVRKHMKTLLNILLRENEESAQRFIQQIRKEFEEYDIEDIAFPRGISEIDKFRSVTTIYTKGTPIHARGALLYNKLIRDYDLESVYEPIRNGDKIKFVYLNRENPIRENVISFLQIFPRELPIQLQDYIDYDTMFEKTFLEPMRSVFEALDWSMKETNTLDSFFT